MLLSPVTRQMCHLSEKRFKESRLITLQSTRPWVSGFFFNPVSFHAVFLTHAQSGNLALQTSSNMTRGKIVLIRGFSLGCRSMLLTGLNLVTPKCCDWKSYFQLTRDSILLQHRNNANNAQLDWQSSMLLLLSLFISLFNMTKVRKLLTYGRKL
jgi:hypothetical protein